MSTRAGVLITGTEVLGGRVRDLNGPWLAERLLELGVELAHVAICGDRPEDIEAQLRFMAGQGVDLIVTSGGLGPTPDDLTLAVVAGFTGRALALDEALEGRIAKVLAPLMKRWPDLDFEAVRASNRKQALVPDGATILEPAGTAPGMVVPPRDRAGPTIVVLPGPPRELQELWRSAVLTEPFRAATAAAAAYRQSTLRLFGIPESEMAETLRVAEQQIDGFELLEVTTCLRRGEVEVVVRHEPAAEEPWHALEELISRRHARSLFSTDGSTVDQQVAELLEGRTIATAESCTAGMMAARLAERPGSSAYLLGGTVAYSNRAKVDQLGVEAGLIERHGAVSDEVAEAMAAGASARFEAEVAIAITGIAGPGGGSEHKPVGTVCWCVLQPGGARLAQRVQLPGDRAQVRDRATTIGMHMLRRLLRGEDAVP